MRHVLVVANQTLAGKELLAVLKEELGQGEFDVYVVVPATTPAEDHTFVSAGLAGPVTPGTRASETHADAFDVAQRRLEKGLALIGDLGIRVEGEVGDSDPAHAVDEVLARLNFDEIIVSTLPHNVSHWLRGDLPARIQRKHHLPVRTVTAHGGGRD